MKFNKLFLFVTMLAAGMAFTSCDNEDEYVPGLPAGEHNIGFESEENVALAMTQESIEVELTRTNTEGYLAVPLEALIVPECITLPDSARFEDGSATATIELLVDSTIQMFTDYQVSFRVPEAYTNAYAEDGLNPVFNIIVKKEDFRTVANGIYDSKFWFEEQWEQSIEYSEVLGLYRFPNCFEAGSHWYYAYDGETFTFTDSEGNAVEKFLSGVVHPTYGAVSVTLLSANPYGYFEGGGEGMVGHFKFPFQFTCSAGSFGSAYEYYYVLEWVEKPWEGAEAE